MSLWSRLVNTCAFILTTSACVTGQAQTTTNAAVSYPVHYFISIDGLQGDLLRTLNKEDFLTADHGFHWLLTDSLVATKAWPVVTTLTAPSHVSTITCSPPSRHGIIANAFLKDGTKVSGFSETFASEPLWRAAMRQGKKVLALAYVGSDGLTTERSADFGINYPDDRLLAQPQTLAWELSALAPAANWTLTKDLAAKPTLKEATATLTLNPVTKEERAVQILIDTENPEAPRYWFDSDKDLTNGFFGTVALADATKKPVDAFFVEENTASALRGFKRRAFFYPLPADAGKLSVYVSAASYNAAYPESFRQRLDDLGLVWPNYGIKSPKLPFSEFVATQAMIDRFLAEVGAKMVPELGVDIVLFYQPLIDSLGHSRQADLPRPFAPKASDEVSRAFVDAFQVVDANLGQLLANAPPETTVAIMGDHGMDAIKKTVNLAAVLPAAMGEKVQIVTSGSLTLVYAVPDLNPSSDQVASVDEAALELKTKLAALTDDGHPVLELALSRKDFKLEKQVDYTQEWQYGEALWAFMSAEGYYFVNDPKSQAVFGRPSAQGMHGTALTIPSMATTLLVKSAKVHGSVLSETSLINAVPTFSQLVGISPPKDCLGRSLVGGK